MSDWWQSYEEEICDLLRTHEQEVRERIAQAIEAMPNLYADFGNAWVAQAFRKGQESAARIARDGGAS